LGLQLSSNAQVKSFLVDLDATSEDYSVHHFKLATNSLYGTDDTIQLFNVVPKYKLGPREQEVDAQKRTRFLFLFSVMPTFDSSEDWVVFDRFPSHIDILTFNKLFDIAGKSISITNTPRVPEQYGILLKKKDRYYQSKSSFLQTFYIKDYPKEFNVPANVIDINQDLLPLIDMKRLYEEVYHLGDFPIIPDYHSKHFDNRALERFYLSKKEKVGGSDAYQFWTFRPKAEVSHGESWENGIERFLYTPDRGIIGGSFDFYFEKNFDTDHRKRRTINMKVFKDNILHEKIMVAEGLR